MLNLWNVFVHKTLSHFPKKPTDYRSSNKLVGQMKVALNTINLSKLFVHRSSKQLDKFDIGNTSNCKLA